MARWIAFDPQSAAELANRIGISDVEIRQSGIFSSAFHSPVPALLLLPSNHAEKTILVRIENPRFEDARVRNAAAIESSASQPEVGVGPQPADARADFPQPPPHYAAAGFLGLSDEAVFENDQSAPPPEHRWWGRWKR